MASVDGHRFATALRHMSGLQYLPRRIVCALPLEMVLDA
jgi:hypothetical protein